MFGASSSSSLSNSSNDSSTERSKSGNTASSAASPAGGAADTGLRSGSGFRALLGSDRGYVIIEDWAAVIDMGHRQ